MVNLELSTVDNEKRMSEILKMCIRDRNYIGVKIVKAEPQEKDGKAGYKVVYPDGYVSWSPKDAFEKAYRELDCIDFINDRK